MILDLAWIEVEEIHLDTGHDVLEIKNTRTIVRKKNQKISVSQMLCLRELLGIHMITEIRRARKKSNSDIKMFAASIKDIKKTLKKKKETDPGNKLPGRYHQFLEIFDSVYTDSLLVHRSEIDIHIEIEKNADRTKKEIPWSLLYNMSRDELLVLRKIFTELLDKGFIRMSNLSAAASVLFAKKPDDGLGFYIDYRVLNAIIRKDRYPFSLVHETLREISKTKGFIKLDIRTAFHKICMTTDEKWKTVFRIQYSSYEWLITSFGLANASATFQHYINWIFRDFLDDFVSVYIDDILIYTNGILEEHRVYIDYILARLQKTGLQLDIDKCEFEIKKMKYLGFIIEVETGLFMDPEKIYTVMEWTAFQSVKEVRSFIGFANFYHTFIEGFAEIAALLIGLTKKNAVFHGDVIEQKAFERLKEVFISESILVQGNPTKETIMKTDISGYCIGDSLL